MEFPAVKPADSADDFLLFSDAINRLTQGMWGGLRRPDPVVSAKSKFKNASVGFGPWRELAARRLTAAALNGKLTVYIIPNQDIQPGNNSVAAKQIHSAVIPLEVLKALIRTRGSLSNHPIRPSIKTAAGDEKLYALLTSGTFAVCAAAFEAWYEAERAKYKWPSQRSTLKKSGGRPSKQTEPLRNALLALVERDAWHRNDGITKLHRLLVDSGHFSIPSPDTLERLVDQLHRETGNRRLLRTPRFGRKRN